MTYGSRFPDLVSLACHDMRTPLATVYGFARTLAKAELEQPAARYIEMIEAATAQVSELIDELSLVARIETGAYQPALMDVDSLALVREAVAEFEDDTVAVSGEGAAVRVDVEPTRRALEQLVRAARRHGGLERVEVAVAGPAVGIGPLTEFSAPVVLGRELRELQAAAAVALVEALGGSVSDESGRLVVRLPAA
jgi:two-component system phosphate regulon sensor histidine kinase PhoR